MEMERPTIEDLDKYPAVVMTNPHKWKPKIFDSLKTADEYLSEIKNLVPRALDSFTDDGRFIIKHALRHTPPFEQFSCSRIEEIDPSHTATLDDKEENGEQITTEIESSTNKVVEQTFNLLNAFLTPILAQEATVEADWLIHSVTHAFDTEDNYLVAQPNFVPTGIKLEDSIDINTLEDLSIYGCSFWRDQLIDQVANQAILNEYET